MVAGSGGVRRRRTTVDETAIYVYGVGRGLPAESVARVRGVADAPVETLDAEGLTAVVSRVSLAEFGEDALRRNLEHLDWLEATARAHHAVVDTVAERADDGRGARGVVVVQLAVRLVVDAAMHESAHDDAAPGTVGLVPTDHRVGIEELSNALL